MGVVMWGLFFLAVYCVSVCECDKTIRYATVLYRHGDRTPVDLYPNDPWRNESLWPVQFGELTNLGKRQHYALGQWLRKRYSHLLSTSFNRDEIYVRSTDVDRTLMSAQANLAGMYPPVNDAIWNPDLMWQPIPVHTLPEKQDNLLAMEMTCPAYDAELEDLKTSRPYLEQLSKYQILMDYLSKYTGTKVKDYDDINSIYSTLHIESINNFKLPAWTNSVFPDAMKEPSVYSFKVATDTPLLAKLKIGPFMKQFAQHVNETISNETNEIHNNLKLSIYSGHDFTVGCLLNGLGMYTNELPDFTATVLMELIFAQYIYYVRISYRNTPHIVEPIVLEIPNCGKLCRVDKFLELYEDLININWENDCSIQITRKILVPLLILMGAFVTMYCCHLRRTANQPPDVIEANIPAQGRLLHIFIN